MLDFIKAVIGFLLALFMGGRITMIAANEVLSEQAKLFLFDGNVEYVDSILLTMPLAVVVVFIVYILHLK